MPPGTHKTLSGIPVKVIDASSQKVKPVFHWKRRAVQWGTLLLVVLIPVSGLFRIDPEVGAFVVLDRQIWFSDFFLISGLWILLASGLVALYSTAGTVFCGWACPQNTLAEWANHMTHKLLGRRAEVSLTGDAPQVAAAKNKVLNWALLGSAFLGAAMLFALVPLIYFYPPDVVWSFIIWRPDPRLAGSMHWIYAVCTLIILLDIAVIRHFWCRFACVYRVWQHSFKTRQTLHIAYDAARAEECAGCNYCVTACFVDLDPRKTEVYDSCINCGECIDACNRIHTKSGGRGLLRFELGARAQTKARKFRDNTMSLLSRFGWTAPFGLLGATLFIWGIATYAPYHMSVGRMESPLSQSFGDYRIAISNKRYRPTELAIRVEGLPASAYHLSAETVKLDPVGHALITLSIAPDLARGLYPLVVEVRARDGWVGHFSIQHLAAG